MANATIHELGTLFTNGSKRPFPKNPVDGGDIFKYADNGKGKIEIRDTDSDPNYKLKWVEVNTKDKKLLICDRCILVKVSWDELKSQGFVDGKKIIIDGQEYLCRLLTGGNDFRTGSDYYAGGKLPNEWDDIIVNEGNYSGLPKPNSTDLAGQNQSGEHNKFWNWHHMYSWCQEKWAQNAAKAVVRGYNSARCWGCYDSSNKYAFCGFRPVLEILNAAPAISGEDIDLGVIKGNTFTKNYNVTEPDGDTFSIEEKVDGELIRRLENQTDGQFTLDLSNKLSSLAYTNHTITITATDSKGASSVRTWTFKRVNDPPSAPRITNFSANNTRMDITNFEVEFEPSQDPDKDKQYFTLEVANDTGFSQNKYTQTAELFVYDIVRQAWVSQEFCEDMYATSKWKFVVKGKVSADTKEKYIRVGTTDKIAGHPIAYSNHVKVKTCNKLEFSTQPISLDYQPTGANVTINATIDARATTSVLVTNNANDPEPVWENMTQEWKEDKFHTFVNKSQTGGWAVAYKVIVNANDATGEISVSEILMGVK